MLRSEATKNLPDVVSRPVTSYPREVLRCGSGRQWHLPHLYVDDGDGALFLDHLDGAGDGGTERRGVLDGPLGVGAAAASDRAVINLRILEIDADALGGAITLLGGIGHMAAFADVAAVVQDEQQQRDMVVDGSPDGRGYVHEIAIAIERGTAATEHAPGPIHLPETSGPGSATGHDERLAFDAVPGLLHQTRMRDGALVEVVGELAFPALAGGISSGLDHRFARRQLGCLA